MKNILGTQEDLKLYNKAGVMIYNFREVIDGYSYECTFDENGNELTYKNSVGGSCEYTYNENGDRFTFKDSNGNSSEYTYDENGKRLTFKNSDGYSWKKTYDENGNELTYKNSDGTERGFDIPELTMEQVVEKVGNFKLIK